MTQIFEFFLYIQLKATAHLDFDCLTIFDTIYFDSFQNHWVS